MTVPPKRNYQGSPAQRPPLSWVQAETRRILDRLDEREARAKLEREAATLDRLGVRPSIRPQDYPQDGDEDA